MCNIADSLHFQSSYTGVTVVFLIRKCDQLYMQIADLGEPKEIALAKPKKRKKKIGEESQNVEKHFIHELVNLFDVNVTVI